MDPDIARECSYLPAEPESIRPLGGIRMVLEDLIEQWFTLKVVFEDVVGKLVPIGRPNDSLLTEP